MNNKTGKKIKQQTREEFYENDKRKQPKRSELERVGCDDVKWKLSLSLSLAHIPRSTEFRYQNTKFITVFENANENKR